MKIWKFNTIEVGLSSFFFPEEEDIDYFVELIDGINETPTSIREIWKPIIMLKKKQRIDPDFFELYDTGAVIVSDKGKVLLDSILKEGTFELLPFQNDERPYYLFNLLHFNTGALNKKRSYFEEFSNKTISKYDLLAFNYNNIVETPFFRISELPYELFVTDVIQEEYDEMELKGVNFDHDNLVYVD